MSLYDASVPQFKKMLGNLGNWLEKAATFAEQKSFDKNVLLSCRLAPDQFALIRQIQSACDTAKLTSARLSGKDAPSHPDNEQTFEELRARIQSVVEYLDTLRPEDFASAETRLVPLFFLKGKASTGRDYLHEWGLPNFYFHLVAAYCLLRHNGVQLGKYDYIGMMNFQDA